MRGELPVSVVIPHQLSRDEFFRRFCLPSIEANGPAEIIVEANDGSKRTGAPWRNAGAARATQPFIFFVDDDTILAVDCIRKLLDAAFYSKDLQVRYSYCDFFSVTMPGGRRLGDHPVAVQHMQDFGAHTLRRGSVCSGMILIERAAFCGFDETLRQLDDWDLTLTLLERGIHGVRVPEPLFFAFYMDAGVSDRATIVPAVHAVQKKHGMLPGA